MMTERKRDRVMAAASKKNIQPEILHPRRVEASDKTARNIGDDRDAAVAGFVLQDPGVAVDPVQALAVGCGEVLGRHRDDRDGAPWRVLAEGRAAVMMRRDETGPTAND